MFEALRQNPHIVSDATGNLLCSQHPKWPSAGCYFDHAFCGALHVRLEGHQCVNGIAIKDKELWPKAARKWHGPWHFAGKILSTRQGTSISYSHNRNIDRSLGIDHTYGDVHQLGCN